MTREVIRVPGLSEWVDAAGVPLSVVTRGGGLVFVSGMPPIDVGTMSLVSGDVAVQTAKCMDNVKAALEAAGSSLDKVMKVTLYATNAAYYGVINEAYARYFPKDPPARTFVTVASWPLGFDVEIDCIAQA